MPRSLHRHGDEGSSASQVSLFEIHSYTVLTFLSL